MPDPATVLVAELIEIAIQYLCERELLETFEAIDANFARQPTSAEELSIAISISRKILELRLRPPARKRGRPPQRRQRHLQIAGAVVLVEDDGLDPTRSHALRWRRDPSACSVVACALEQLGDYLGDYLGSERRDERLRERAVEDIWNQYRLSPLIFHQGATDFARNHRYRISSRIIR
jgi:hypothetical protein